MTLSSKILKKILLVDDEQDIREVLSITLEDMGFDVHTAENGQKALTLFEQQKFSIVLTDIKMPGMDGIDLLKKIKSISPFTEVIMITGHGDMELAIESFRNEAVEFITKPVDVIKLEVAIRRAEEKMEIRKGVQEYTQNLENLVWKKTEALKQADKDKATAVPSLDYSAPPDSTVALDDSGKSISDHHQDKKNITSIMETLPLIIFFVDHDLKISVANKLFKEKFGDPSGKYCYELCMGQKAPCIECPALQTFKHGTSRQIEKKFTNIQLKSLDSSVDDYNSKHNENNAKYSESMNYLVWSSPIPDKKSNTVSEALIMATDITKVLDIQDHLTSLGLMIGSVSHGIKGLLTGLDGGVYLLNSALNKDDQALAQEGLDMVRQMTAKIRKMILDILFYAKERDLYIEDIPATAFAMDLISIIKPKAEKNGITFISQLPEHDFTFKGDSAILHAALINIFDNAVDACKDDDDKFGNGEKQHKISFQLKKSGENIEFVISDNGIGMEKDEIEKAFTLFHSGKGKKGTGLGLFISQKSIQQHNGYIKVTSEKDSGTSFFVTLPTGSGTK